VVSFSRKIRLDSGQSFLCWIRESALRPANFLLPLPCLDLPLCFEPHFPSFSPADYRAAPNRFLTVPHLFPEAYFRLDLDPPLAHYPNNEVHD